jgi:polar amino acid transport system substrate-binding protein
MKPCASFLRLLCVLGLLMLAALLTTPLVSATGPRVSASLFAPHANQIYALDLPPFIGSNLPSGGMNAEILRAALGTGQVEFVLNNLPLQTMLKYYLLQEKALAVLGRDMALSEDERDALIFVPLFVGQESYWYHAPSRPQLSAWNGKLEYLAGRSCGALKGEEVAPYQAAGIKVDYGRPKGLLEELIAGKLDLVRLPDPTIDWLIRHYFPRTQGAVVRLTPPIGDVPLFVVFNRQHPEGEAIAEKFRQELVKLLANGRYRKILEHHLPQGADLDGAVKRLKLQLKQP